MNNQIAFSEVVDHISLKGNPVKRYDITFCGSPVVSVFSKNVRDSFLKMIEIVTDDNSDPVLRSKIGADLLHVCHHMDNKLEGLDSLSTSCLHNEICLRRIQNGDSICSHCYAANQQSFQHGLDDNNALNLYILRNVRILPEHAKTVPLNTVYCRIESFGDIESVNQGLNYVTIINAHADQHFAIWSKNLWIWSQVFEIVPKPANTTFVQSSIFMNRQDTPKYPFVDYVFTVWETEEIANDNGVEITCGGRKCLTCLRCYKKGNSVYVDELKK